jgi:hypothetical protein
MPNMGIQATPPSSKTSLADALFAATSQRLIGLLFGQAGRTFYAPELSRGCRALSSRRYPST